MRRLLLTLLFFPAFVLHAQDTLRLRITAVDQDTAFITKIYNYRRILPDEKNITLEIGRTLNAFYTQGYIHAYVRDTVHDKKLRIIKLNIGKEVRWGKISLNAGEEALLSKSGSRFSTLQNKPISFDALKGNIDRLLTYYENNGYPFARVKLDSIKDDNDKLTAHLHIEKNKLVIIDSINIVGGVKISRQYLYNYINVKPGILYDEEIIANISTRVKELLFLDETRPPAITFFSDKAILNLFLKNKNANRFDLLIGFLPNSSPLPTQSSLLITGDGQLNLVNAMSHGEQINIHFEKLQARTTRVNAGITYPYLLSLPFGIDAAFNLFLNDTLYRNLDYNIGIQYLFKGANYIKGYYKVFQSRVLTIDTAAIIASKQLPTTLDMTTQQYGIEYNFERTDFRFNPRKGYSLYLNGSVGTRRIDENAQIVNLKDPFNPEFDFHSLYDSLKRKTNEYHLQVTAAYYFPVAANSVVKVQYANEYLIGNNILANELFRLGGYKTIRGFDEESILAKWNNTMTVEYRYLLGQFSYFDLFSEVSYLDRYTGTSFVTDVPIGIGTGITFQTRAGIFGISYALGRTETNPFQFKDAKIHFGYVNVF